MIQTVRGLKEKRSLGNVLMHEHIGCISNDLLQTFGKEWIDKENLISFASDILKRLKDECDIGLFVDGTPIDLGRDAKMLLSVSEKSGVDIVASAGLYHFPAMYTINRSGKEIADWFIKEFEEGIEGTNIKPGILKVASQSFPITNDNKKRLIAMAIAQNETKLPIYVHSEHIDFLANEQISILCTYIKDTEKIIIGHAALNPDEKYLEEILDKGCYICMDQCHCVRHHTEKIGKALATLCKKGYSNKILLSNDMCIYSDFGCKESTGLELSVRQQVENFKYIFTTIYESFLENGGNKKDWNKMFKENSIEVLDIK